MMQKVLTEMNLKIHHVFSDIDGVSAQSIITAILAGERDPDALAQLRERSCRSSAATIAEALRGNYREEYLVVLKLAQRQWQRIREDIKEIDQTIEKLMKAECSEGAGPLPQGKASQHRLHKNSPQLDIFQLGYNYYGVDLSTAPGVASGLLSVLMSEVGTRDDLLRNFKTGAHFASWLGLCPDNRISGGRVLKAKTRKVNSALSQAFRLAAQGLSRSQEPMGRRLAQLKARLGKAEGITALAHKLARVVFGMIEQQCAYDDSKAFHMNPQNLARARRRLEAQAARLGCKIVAQTPQEQKAA
jgi:transposase